MQLYEFFILIGVFIAMMFLYRNADKWVKRLGPKTSRTINWIGFAAAALGGILWYVLNYSVFMFITFIGIVVYFIFYGYDRMEEKKEEK